MNEEWYLADPEKLAVERIDLTLGLRSSIRYYNDLVAPGIGNVSFIRQITWSLIAVKYAKLLKVSAIKLANSIEALGLKAFYNAETDRTKYIYRGTRAFERTNFSEINSYRDLCQPRNYVQITYRQNTTRSLPFQTGLGFVEGNTSFEGFTLTAAGTELISNYEAEYPRPSIEHALSEWVINNKTMSAPALAQRFGPTSTESEKNSMSKRIVADVSPLVPGIRGDVDRRQKLIKQFELLPAEWNTPEFKELINGETYKNYREDFDKALQFFALLHSAQNVLVRIYAALKEHNGKVKSTAINSNEEISVLLQRSKEYVISNNSELDPQAKLFAKLIIDNESDRSKIYSLLCDRDRRVAIPTDGFIVKGPLYRDNIETEEDSDIGHMPKSIRNLFSLWQEAYVRK